jgi:hypothetical protein
VDHGNLDVSTLQHYLRGVEFPAEKEQVAQAAESSKNRTSRRRPKGRTREGWVAPRTTVAADRSPGMSLPSTSSPCPKSRQAPSHD